jgi:hypothetical protein
MPAKAKRIPGDLLHPIVVEAACRALGSRPQSTQDHADVQAGCLREPETMLKI